MIIILMNKAINATNKFLKSLALKNNVKILDKTLYLCSQETSTCEFFTDKGEKINL